MFSYVFMKLLEGRPETYDRRVERVSGGHIHAVKEDIAKRIAPGRQVLELGCGTGELAVMMAGRGADVLAIDASEKMIAEARKRVAQARCEDRIHLDVLSVADMDRLDAGRFDTVVATLVLSELNEDELRYALRHVHRVLKPGGEVIVADEALPTTLGRKLTYQAVRVPMLVATYLVSSSKTRPLEDLSGTLKALGMEVLEETRSLGDAFVLVVARKPEEVGA